MMFTVILYDHANRVLERRRFADVGLAESYGRLTLVSDLLADNRDFDPDYCEVWWVSPNHSRRVLLKTITLKQMEEIANG